jgi:uncharacterized protein (DUF1697 family)
MALVVFLRGVNVGGHRTFRPTLLVERLKHLDVVNIGAAGTFVVRKPVTRARLRAELLRGLPFDAHIMIVQGREIVAIMDANPFGGQATSPDLVPFVSVLARRPVSPPPTPLSLPPAGPWGLKIIARQGVFVFGVYRRNMEAIRHLSAIDRLFGVPATTRNWNTMTAVAKVVRAPAPRGKSKGGR